MKKKAILLLVLIAVSLPAYTAIDKVSISGTYVLETITRESGVNEEKITSAGIGVHGSSFFSPYSDLGMRYWVGFRKPLSWIDGSTTLDVTNVPIYVDAGVALAYQVPVNLDIFLEMGAGFQYSLQSMTDSGITVELGTFYANAFIEFNYAIQSNFFLSAGALAGYPLYVDGSLKIGPFAWSGQEGAKGLYLAPYVAVSFAY